MAAPSRHHGLIVGSNPMSGPERPSTNVAAQRRSRSQSIEDGSLHRLVFHLRGQGHVAEVQGRPDREGRPGRAVDAELSVDGQIVAVEITQLISDARAQHEMARLVRGLQEPLNARVRERRLGSVVVDLDFRSLPPKRQVVTAVAALLEDLMVGVGALDSAPTTRRDVDVATRVPFIRNLKLIQLPDAADEVTWLESSDEVGGWLGPLADEFVCHLLDSKATQAIGYPEVWLAIVDRDGLIGAGLLSQALTAHRAQIPDNWTRILFLPATGHMAVVDLGVIRPGAGSAS